MTRLPGLVRNARPPGIVIDTNILLMYVIGVVDPARIETFKRTRSASFRKDDVEILNEYLRSFVTLATTPNILTEVSNLLGGLGRDELPSYRGALRQLVVRVLDERYLPSDGLTRDRYFLRLGLTDTAIVHAARQGFRVLTDDAGLANALYEEGWDVINFNHLRGLDP